VISLLRPQARDESWGAVSLASSGFYGQNLIQFSKLYCFAAVCLRRTYWRTYRIY